MRTHLLRRHFLVIISSAILAAMVLTACSSGAGDSSSGRTLHIVHGSTPNQFDPCGTPNGSELAYMTAIYAPLIRTDPATGELSPGIATDWETSKDGLTLTLKLQEGLTFQDGTPLNASTVAQSLNQCLDIGHQEVPGLEEVTADGDSAVVFSLSTPSAGLVELLGDRLGYVASPAAREKEGDDYGASPVGAGPYKMSKFVPGSSVTLTAWDDYKDAGLPPAKVSTIESSLVDEPSAQVAALTSGEAEFGFRLDSSVVDGLEDSSVEVTSDIGVSIADLNVDRSQGPMQDVRVRQAISYAIDRKALVKSISDGLSDVGSVQPYPPGHPRHFDDLDDAYSYNINKAKKLLADAGYSDGLRLRGVSLSGSSFVDTAVIVSNQLSDVGIDIKFEEKELPDATKSFYTNHEFDLMSTGMNSGPDWITIYRRLLATDSAGNAGNEPLPGGDKALKRLNKAKGEEELTRALHEATKLYQEELPIIPLYYSPFTSAWTSDVTGGQDAYTIDGEADLTALGLK